MINRNNVNSPAKLADDLENDSVSDSYKDKPKKKEEFDTIAWILLFCVVFITYCSFPENSVNTDDSINLMHVWYCGWLTAVSTGLGVIPFLFLQKEPEKYWVGISNAIASGMMIAASFTLSYEGLSFNEVQGLYGYHSGFRMVFGLLMGILFIIITKNFLDQHEDLSIGDIHGASAQKIFLIILVMTLHSFTEGIGIGVSFGGKNGLHLGKIISLSLGVHNIPEGIAVCAVLTSRRVSRLRSSLWAIFTSLPQPIFALLAFAFVERMLYCLPFGLGFAAGAMGYVAIFELFADAMEVLPLRTTVLVSIVAFILMFCMQELVKHV